MPGEFRRREISQETYKVFHTVDNSHQGVRADHFLKTCLKTKSRAFIQKCIDDGSILLSRRLLGELPKLKASTTLQIGDEIEVVLHKGKKEEPIVDFNYRVIFEDEYLMIIDKTGNLPVHPAGRFFFNTLLTHLRRERFDHIEKGHDFYLVHRIDRETSGLLLVAKQSRVAKPLVDLFFEHKVEKRYYALVMGRAKTAVNETFIIDKPMGSDLVSNVKLKMAVRPDGVSALTQCKLINRGPRFDLIECRPKTGRQHQIRVHLASEGLPLVGDKLYGGYDHLFLNFLYDGVFSDEMWRCLHSKRHALHAYYLAFRHPITGEQMQFESPLPPDLEVLLNEIQD